MLQFIEGLAQFLLRVHDDRAVPGDRLTDGPAGDEQEAHRGILGIDQDLVAVLKDDQGAVAQPWLVLRIEIVAALALAGKGIRVRHRKRPCHR